MEELFLQILNRSITAGWLILAVIALRLLLRRAPRWLVCLLWLPVAVRLICPFTLESPFSVLPGGETITVDTIKTESSSLDSGVGPADDGIGPVILNTIAAEPKSGVTPLQMGLWGAAGLWMSGTAGMLFYALFRYLQLYRRVRTAVRSDHAVYISEFTKTPFILGVIRPRIYLPNGMDRELSEAVISHEQAHLRRGDHLWKPLGYLLLSVYWYHPLCWIAYSLFCRDIELACDEKVIYAYSAQQKKLYSEALLACSTDRRMISACPLAFGEVGVQERIRSVLHYKKPAFWVILTGIAALVVVTVCFLTDPASEKSAGQPSFADFWKITKEEENRVFFATGLRLTCPDIWNGKVLYETDTYDTVNTLLVCEKSNAEAGVGGDLFYLNFYLYDKEDSQVELLETEKVLGRYRAGEEEYILTFDTPGDRTYAENDPPLEEAYLELSGLIDQVEIDTGGMEDFTVCTLEELGWKTNTEQAENPYGPTIAGLGDDDAYAFLVMEYPYNVLLVSDMLYDTGTEKQAAIVCDVYYFTGGEVKNLGTVSSGGTTYPIQFTQEYIFIASGHSIEQYVISDKDGTLNLKKGIYEIFDENGNASYTCVQNGRETQVTMQDFMELTEEYAHSQTVHFAYGAADCLNEIQPAVRSGAS